MAVAAKLLAEALELPPTERAELAGRLFRSLDEGAAEDPATIETAWSREIARRLREIDAGAVRLLDEDEADRVLISDEPDRR